jgi:hypothetical protein
LEVWAKALRKRSEKILFALKLGVFTFRRFCFLSIQVHNVFFRKIKIIPQTHSPPLEGLGVGLYSLVMSSFILYPSGFIPFLSSLVPFPSRSIPF